MLEICPIKAFDDNYIWLVKTVGSQQSCVVDPGDGEAVLRYVKKHKLILSGILITHHHGDHTGGIEQILQVFPVPVYGPESQNIPNITHPVKEGDSVTLLGESFKVIEIPGHTMDHIAYYTSNHVNNAGPLLFCGDTLFAGGCGRVFEGTHAMMHKSLQKLAALAPDTQVFCAHEYTLANLEFAKAVNPDSKPLVERIQTEQKKRAQNIPTIPSSIAEELQTNPFLRCDDPDIIASVSQHSNHQNTHFSGQALNQTETVFAGLRQWKDTF